VAHRLSGMPTVSFPGVTSWRKILPVLEKLGACAVRVAFDADAAQNASVARALRECVRNLQAAQYAVELERWPSELGKGIDDLLAAGGSPDILTGHDLESDLQKIAVAAGLDPDTVSEKPNEAVDDPHRLARLYIERHGTIDGIPSLWCWRDVWHRWDGLAYRDVPDTEIQAEITRLVKAEFDAENFSQLEAGEHEKPPTCRKVTKTLVSNVVHAVQSEILLSRTVEQPVWLLEEAPFPAREGLSTTSGIVHLPSLISEKASLAEPTPVFFSGNALTYPFDPNAECPEWLKFLESVWGDDREAMDTLAQWFGYCLLPDTSHHKLLMLVGPPRSGKGTIARMLRALIGVQNLASPSLASLAGPFGLWPLLGKLVALVPDARLSGRVDAIAVLERILSITGEDPQDVARKNLPTLSGIRLPVRFVIMTNELPNMRDASGAILSRLILLRMTRSFHGKEDRHLETRLLQELPGILKWSIDGWRMLHQAGHFVQPASGQELIMDMQDLSSPISAFIRDCCEEGDGFAVPISLLFDAWRDWCHRHGRDHVGTQQSFGRDLRAAVPKLDTSQPRRPDGSRERVYRGIGLRN